MEPGPVRRSRSRETSEGFEISIPAKQSLLFQRILGPVIAVWGMEEVFAAMDLFLRADDHASASSSPAWLIAWTCVGVFLFYLQFWMIIGVELVIFRPATLLIRREFGGFDRSKEYDLRRIRNLRVASSSRSPFDWSEAMHFLGVGSGPIAFDYGSERVRFGTGVHETEAREIVTEMRSRYPFPETSA
jgi:hypothetical protein